VKDTENRRICRALARMSVIPHEDAFTEKQLADGQRRRLRNLLKKQRKARS
jgi:hypothetical protein